MLHVSRATGLLWRMSLAIGLASRASAQAPLPSAGQRVRVESLDGNIVTGTVRPSGQDSLRIAVAGPRTSWNSSDSTVVLLSRAQVRQYDVSAGRDYWRGIGWGAGVGALLGTAVIVAGVVADHHSPDAIIPSFVVTVPIALASTALGAGVGAIVAPERWRGPMMLTFGAARGARQMGVGLSFALK